LEALEPLQELRHHLEQPQELLLALPLELQEGLEQRLEQACLEQLNLLLDKQLLRLELQLPKVLAHRHQMLHYLEALARHQLLGPQRQVLLELQPPALRLEALAHLVRLPVLLLGLQRLQRDLEASLHFLHLHHHQEEHCSATLAALLEVDFLTLL